MNEINELVMEQAAGVNTANSRSTSLKSILFIVHDDDGLEDRLQAALSLARACSGHLKLLHVVPVEAYTVVDTYGSAFASGAIVETLTAEAHKLRTKLEQHLAAEDVVWSYEVTLATTIPALIRAAALADIVFIGRLPAYHEITRTGPGLAGDLVGSARVPILIPGDEAKSFNPFGKALIAWNGSIEAAHAVRSTIGLLELASEVRVAFFDEGKDVSISETEVLEFLSMHGVHAELHKGSSSDVAGDLIHLAASANCEYIVLGGYSHSRAGEYLFGGVTRQLLHGSPLPVVMAR